MSLPPAAIRVLVASADETVRNLVWIALAGGNYDVTEVADATAAIRAVASAVPAVAILDQALPDVGGLAAARALHGQDATAGIRVVLLGDLADPVPGERLQAAGVDAVVLRPFDAFGLLDAVEGQLAAVR